MRIYGRSEEADFKRHSSGAGLLLGWKNSFVAIGFGVLCALVAIGAKKFVFRRACSLYDGAEEFAFAPYLVAGVAFALFAGDAVLNLYLSLFL